MHYWQGTLAMEWLHETFGKRNEVFFLHQEQDEEVLQEVSLECYV